VTYLTTKQAAIRVERDARTISRWIAAGLQTVTIRGRVFIREADLLSFYRAKLVAGRSRKRPRGSNQMS
jgi:hypothetical protein